MRKLASKFYNLHGSRLHSYFIRDCKFENYEFLMTQGFTVDVLIVAVNRDFMSHETLNPNIIFAVLVISQQIDLVIWLINYCPFL